MFGSPVPAAAGGAAATEVEGLEVDAPVRLAPPLPPLLAKDID
jgi:hypothetical protein